MRPLRSAFAFLLLAFGVGGAVARSGEFVLFKHVWGDAIVATDMSPEGKTLAPPTPQQPVYYRGLSLGHRLGSIPGDREPEVQQLNRMVAGILAKQGYLGARPGHEPTLFLILQWGYLTPGREDLFWFLGYDPNKYVGIPVLPLAIETAQEDAQDAIYGIIITAFEFKSVHAARPVVYWQTRIGLPAVGKSMAAALPVMLVAAGPAIGRPSKEPVLLDADNPREGTVKLNELKFLEFIDGNPPPTRPEPKK
jgi:hypothetical protein